MTVSDLTVAVREGAPALYRKAATYTLTPTPTADPIEVLSPYSAGRLLAWSLYRCGLRGSEDLDGRRYLAQRNAEGGWTLVGREGALSAVEAAVAVLVEALPEPPAATADYLRAWNATRDLLDRPGWPSWRTTAAREALDSLCDDCSDTVDAETASRGWQIHGERPSTARRRALAEEHLATFLEYLPSGRHLRSEVARQYAETAALSGIPPVHRFGKGRLFDRLHEARFRVSRRATGTFVEVPGPLDSTTTPPLSDETRDTLRRIIASRQANLELLREEVAP